MTNYPLKVTTLHDAAVQCIPSPH